jgi:iron complex outermembrane receptor protein
MSIKIKHIHGAQKPWFKKRALAMAIASALSAAPALAQDDEDTAKDEDGDMEEMVVQGMRQNLMSAQQLKFNADTVVDSITAEDLGSFPDKSIAEALQRVAGVTVNRFAATSDTAHFSAEPSGVLVRGLPHVRTEFNGRDSFSANSSRGLSWGDVSPELMAGVDTYKNQMAELIEGGIAGSVNMRTRQPFDQEGTGFSANFGENYGDLSEDMTPEASALYTTRWDTAVGEMGIMANLAYSEVHTRTQGSQLYRMNRFRDVYTDGNNPSLLYIPGGVNFRDNLYDRERLGGSLAFQWADPEDKLRFSAQYNRTNYEQAWEEYVVQTSPADLSFSQSVFFEVTGQDPNSPTDATTIPVPAPGSDPFTFDHRGLFQTGVITSGTGWWGGDNSNDPGVPPANPGSATFAANESGGNMINACYVWGTAGCDGGAGPTLRSIDASTTTRSNNNENMTQDLSFNLKWELSDTTRANFDLQFVDATVTNYDIEMAFNTFATPSIDLTGEHPRVDLLAGETFNYNPAAFRYSNPNNYYIRSIMDHVEDSEGQQMAFKTDFEFDIGTGWMESLKVGVRAADREQTVRWSSYNWQNVANTWTSGQAPYFNIDQHDPNPLVDDPMTLEFHEAGPQPNFSGYPNNLYVRRGFAGDFFGESGLLNPNTFIFANINLLQNQNQMAATMGAQGLGFTPSGDPTTGAGGWDPICSNFGDRAAELPGSCFTPAEISDVNEETQALYAQLNFGGADAEIFGIPVSGNIGVRYVKTTEESAGGIAHAGLSADELDCELTDPMTPVPQTVGCYLSPDDVAFLNDQDVLDTQSTEHENWLPSFNAKFEFTDELLLRFAASKAMSRPDIGYLRNYLGVSRDLPDVDDANDPLWLKENPMDPNLITGATVKYTAGAQNPFLAPTTAVQYDLSLEWYFSDVGSLTLATFSKDFKDYIQFGKYFRDLTNNGVTRTIEVSGPLNGEGAKITGYEFAYQTFFDFLPEPWTGFGVQMNYTVLNNDGIQTPNLTNVGGEGTIISDQAPDQIGVGSLEGLSEDAYTFILMYENETTESRLAYTWRSEYMVTAVDCCVAYPIWTQDYGQVDGSITWHLSDNFDFRLEGKNLSNEETVNMQQVSNSEDGGLLMPTGWFQNDRTYTIGIGYQY